MITEKRGKNMRDYFKKDQPVCFISPIDGDCVNVRDGMPTDNGINIPVTVKAPVDCEVYINGIKAIHNDGFYRARINISGYRNTIVARDRTNGTEAKIAVYYMPDTIGKYRLSSDDNILFLQDITKNKDVYKSIFENPYLAMYKKAHDLYGAKVHLNLFYEFPGDHKNFLRDDREDFNLSMMTDKFKDEFRANSDWLKLAFHSLKEHPGKPYQHSTAEQITEDCIKVCREIIRFAGPECINDTTTIHFGETNLECARALRALGFKSLTGYFEHTVKGEPLVAYYAPDDLIDHVGERDFWYDTDEDILFGRIDLVLNLKSYDWVMDQMQQIVEHPHRSGFVSIMIHEQYFHKDYCIHLPDFEKRVLDACKFLSDRGYVGAHICDVTKERALRDYPEFNK